MNIRLFHFPDPVLIEGWWRSDWRFTLPETADTSTFEVPVPQEDFREAVVVIRTTERGSEVTVRTFDRSGPEIAVPLITYLSLVALSLKEEFGDGVAFEGHRDHPLFTVSRRPSDRPRTHIRE
ncbi:hypothetical protein [Amycolatopsis sp. lyj-112]|uniref:hypothetical protein n=1 Tax=Amycolatopsis sp. lyj-112 TaxID=2789288 RepID=UPI00397E1FB6